MGGKSAILSDHHISFIKDQNIFFVGTAATKGTVNVSPKGLDTLRIVSNKKIIWLNLTGSGNETAAHLMQNNRMTLMFCAFEGAPMILRAYGKANIFHPRDAEFENLISQFPEIPGSRQIIELNIELVQTSCGFAVPLMDFKSERQTLQDWSLKKGAQGVLDYQQEKNTLSLDGFETGLNTTSNI